MRRHQHFSLDPAFAGFNKWTRAVVCAAQITARPRAPACYLSSCSSRSERPTLVNSTDADWHVKIVAIDLHFCCGFVSIWFFCFIPDACMHDACWGFFVFILAMLRFLTSQRDPTVRDSLAQNSSSPYLCSLKVRTPTYSYVCRSTLYSYVRTVLYLTVLYLTPLLNF